MSNATDIIGYTFNADNYHADCLVAALVAARELSPAALDMSAEDVLDQHAGANAIDRDDESSFDSSEFPKVIFSGTDYDSTCGRCGKALELSSYDDYSTLITREVLSVKRRNGVAGQFEVTVTVRSSFPDAPDHTSATTFVGSTYGGPVVMIMSNGAQVFVRDAERFGNFGSNPDAWVRAFNA